MTAAVLADDDLAMLRLAGEWWQNAAAKEQAIRDRFGVSPVRFYQRVAVVIDMPAAQAAEPLVVARLKRLRAARGSVRRRSTVMQVTR